MGNPYLDRLAAGGKNPHGKKSEKRVAKKMGAKPTPNSGAMRGAKSDAVLFGQYRLEMKCTFNEAMPIELAWLAKIAHEALDHGQTPSVVISFVDTQGNPRLRQYAEWVLLPMAVFKELTDT